MDLDGAGVADLDGRVAQAVARGGRRERRGVDDRGLRLGGGGRRRGGRRVRRRSRSARAPARPASRQSIVTFDGVAGMCLAKTSGVGARPAADLLSFVPSSARTHRIAINRPTRPKKEFRLPWSTSRMGSILVFGFRLNRAGVEHRPRAPCNGSGVRVRLRSRCAAGRSSMVLVRLRKVVTGIVAIQAGSLSGCPRARE